MVNGNEEFVLTPAVQWLEEYADKRAEYEDLCNRLSEVSRSEYLELLDKINSLEFEVELFEQQMYVPNDSYTIADFSHD